jgi:hypothetical protein
VPFEDSPSKRSRTASSDTSRAEKPYPCDQCDLSYENSPSLGRHKREKHGTPTKFGCMHCGAEFLRPEGVKNHIDKNICSSLRGELPPPLTLHHTGDWAPDSYMEGHIASPNGSDSWSPCQDSLPTAPARRLEQTRSYLWSLGASVQNILLSAASARFAFLEYCERYRRDKSRCTRPRPPSRSPWPPAFDLPPPQDLEYLLLLQRRARRRLCVMEAFHLTHRKFTLHALELMDSNPTECRSGQIMRHMASVKQAWKDGVDAAHRLLSGKLPRELHSVLGVAQLASAIRSAMDDIDSPIASEDKFLSDLSRWRQLLPFESYAAFDCYADSLWDNRPPSDLAWKTTQDVDTLVYFQDLLADMLSHIESTPPEEVDLGFAPPPLGVVSHSQDSPTHSPVSSIPIPDQVSPATINNLDIPNEDDFKPSTLADLALYAAGAIFALILAYILRKSPAPPLHKSALTPRSSIHRSLHRPSLVPLLHHYGASITRPPRPVSLAAPCIPSYKLPASPTLDPAIGNGPHPRCRDADPPTSPVYDARRPGVAAAHRAVFRRHCRGQLRCARFLMMIQ